MKIDNNETVFDYSTMNEIINEGMKEEKRKALYKMCIRDRPSNGAYSLSIFCSYPLWFLDNSPFTFKKISFGINGG